jgi:hypothetical protein
MYLETQGDLASGDQVSGHRRWRGSVKRCGMDVQDWVRDQRTIRSVGSRLWDVKRVCYSWMELETPCRWGEQKRYVITPTSDS